MSDLKKHALIIVRAIERTDTDYRGNLLMEVAKLLKRDAQGYTGDLMEKAAMSYGINPANPHED